MLSSEAYCRFHQKAKHGCLQRATAFGFGRCLALMRLKKEPCQESFMLKASTVLLALIWYDTPSVPRSKKYLGT